jgi:hypothetical protein
VVPLVTSYAIARTDWSPDLNRSSKPLLKMEVPNFKVGHSTQILSIRCLSLVTEGFADAQLTDAIKHLAADPGLDPKVRRKLINVLASWFRQFKGDPDMNAIANLYKTARDPNGVTLYEGSDAVKAQREKEREQLLQRAREQQEAKERLRKEKEEAKSKKAAERARSHQQQRQPRKLFNFEEVS